MQNTFVHTLERFGQHNAYHFGIFILTCVNLIGDLTRGGFWGDAMLGVIGDLLGTAAFSLCHRTLHTWGDTVSI